MGDGFSRGTWSHDLARKGKAMNHGDNDERLADRDIPVQVTNLGTVAATLAERGNRYGPFRGHADVTQRLKEVVHEHPKWPVLPRWAREAIDMILHKIGRIMNGDELYEDNWHDIGGYAKLAEDECEPERKRRAA